MAKKSASLNDFSKGLNTSTAERDIEANEFVDVKNFNVYRPGLLFLGHKAEKSSDETTDLSAEKYFIRGIGPGGSLGDGFNSNSIGTFTGQRLFHFKSDYPFANYFGANYGAPISSTRSYTNRYFDSLLMMSDYIDSSNDRDFDDYDEGFFPFMSDKNTGDIGAADIDSFCDAAKYHAGFPGSSSRLKDLGKNVNKNYMQSGIAYPYVDWTLGNELPPLNRVTTSSFPWSEWARWEYEPSTRDLYQLGGSDAADYHIRNTMIADAAPRGWAQTWPFELSRDEYFNMAILCANPEVRGIGSTAYDASYRTEVARMMLRFDRMMSGSTYSENGSVMYGLDTNNTLNVAKASRLRPGTWYKLKAKIKNLSEHPCDYFGLCYDQTILWNYHTTKGGHISYNNLTGDDESEISTTSGYTHATASDWRRNYSRVQFNYHASFTLGANSDTGTFWTETLDWNYDLSFMDYANPPGMHGTSSYPYPLHSNSYGSGYSDLHEGVKFPWVASNDDNEEGTEILDWLDPVSHNYGENPEWLKFNIKSNKDEPEFGYYEIRFKTSMPSSSDFTGSPVTTKAWPQALDKTYFCLALSQYEDKAPSSHTGGETTYPNDLKVSKDEVHKDFMCAIAWLAIEVDTNQSDGVETEIEKVVDEYLVLGGTGHVINEDFTSGTDKYPRNVWMYSLRASTQEDIGLSAWTSEGFDDSGQSFETTWHLGEYPNKLNIEDFVYFDTSYPNFARRKDWLAPYYETNWAKHPFNIDMDYYFINNALRGIDTFFPNKDNGFWKGYISREMYGDAVDYWYRYNPEQASEWKHVHGAWYEAGWFLVDRRFKKPTFGRFFWTGDSPVHINNSGTTNGVSSSTHTWAYPRLRHGDGNRMGGLGSSSGPYIGTAYWDKGWYGSNPEGETKAQTMNSFTSDGTIISYIPNSARTQIAHGASYFRAYSVMTAPEVFWAGYHWSSDSGQDHIYDDHGLAGDSSNNFDGLIRGFAANNGCRNSTGGQDGWGSSPDTVNGHDINVSYSIDAGAENPTTYSDTSSTAKVNWIPYKGNSYGAYDAELMTDDMASKKKLGISYLYDGDKSSDFMTGEQQETGVTAAGDVIWKKMNYKDGTPVGEIGSGGISEVSFIGHSSVYTTSTLNGNPATTSPGYWTFPKQERVLDLTNVSNFVQPLQICWTHGRMLHRANPRLTGFCIYIQDVGEENPTDWCLLFEVNFLTSKYRYYGDTQIQESTILGMQTTSRKAVAGNRPWTYSIHGNNTDFNNDDEYKVIPYHWKDASSSYASVVADGAIPSLHYSGGDLQEQDSTGNNDGDYTEIGHFNSKLFGMASITENYSYFSDVHSDRPTYENIRGTVGGERWCTEVHALRYMPTMTYEDRHGYRSEDLKDDLRYKCSAVGSGKVYIGNVEYDGKSYGDRVIVSPAGKYDTFPVSRFVDYGTSGDGDEIRELLFYKKYLIILKDKSVIIAHEDDIEAKKPVVTHDLKTNGIRIKNNAVNTSRGVFWINKYGLFHFDGEKVKNLLEKEIKIEDVTVKKKRITQQDWSNIFNKDEAYVTYDAELDVVICGDNLNQDTDKNKNEFIYDMVTESFSKYSNSMTSDAMTLPVIAFHNKPIFLASDNTTNESYVWNNDSQEGVKELLLITKDIDFKDPIKRKKFYKLYVTFKSEHYVSETNTYYQNNNSNVVFYYALNGTKNWQEFDYTKSINYTDEGETATQGKRGLIPYENEDVVIGTTTAYAAVSASTSMIKVPNSAKDLLNDGCLIKIGDEVIPVAHVSTLFTNYLILHLANQEQEEGITTLRSINGATASSYLSGETISIFANDWNVAELIPKSTDTDKNNFYSIQFKIEASKGTDNDPDTNTTKVPSNFQINDMNVVYREKKVK